MVKFRHFAATAAGLTGFVSVGAVAHRSLAADFVVGDDAPPAISGPPPLEKEAFESRWEVIVGGGASFEPAYEGGKKMKISPIPIVSIGYADWLQLDPGGLGVTLYKDGGFNVDARLGYEPGRSEGDGDLLKGLGDIDFGVTAGIKAGYEWDAFEFYGIIDKTIGGSEGLVGKIGTSYGWHMGERLIVATSLEATIADKNYMDSYFSVDAAQSAASGLPQYKAKAGLQRVDFDISATYAFDENWLLQAGAGVGLLVGDAANSPIVERELQPKVSLSLGYRF
ncbi:MAG: MltA-interacting MipA family protein [Martelella sp.]|uniref:MipA/OmpV family protein n=1 Tax=unclassified Martelella TaxID=2629616 RepID=UPI000C413BFC|nr:MipA/OmpV family protein [Martelella sp.]MAU23039.1 MltA-interacting MipA family protein [Martelella sp.]